MSLGQLEQRLLVLVTLSLVAFGLVMVYSATSAAAAVGGKDPSYYLKRQGVYAALGIETTGSGAMRDGQQRSRPQRTRALGRLRGGHSHARFAQLRARAERCVPVWNHA